MQQKAFRWKSHPVVSGTVTLSSCSCHLSSSGGRKAAWRSDALTDWLTDGCELFDARWTPGLLSERSGRDERWLWSHSPPRRNDAAERHRVSSAQREKKERRTTGNEPPLSPAAEQRVVSDLGLLFSPLLTGLRNVFREHFSCETVELWHWKRQTLKKNKSCMKIPKIRDFNTWKQGIVQVLHTNFTHIILVK